LWVRFITSICCLVITCTPLYGTGFPSLGRMTARQVPQTATYSRLSGRSRKPFAAGYFGQSMHNPPESTSCRETRCRSKLDRMFVWRGMCEQSPTRRHRFRFDADACQLCLNSENRKSQKQCTRAGENNRDTMRFLWLFQEYGKSAPFPQRGRLGSLCGMTSYGPTRDILSKINDTQLHTETSKVG
jgi:hypothetical protein